MSSARARANHGLYLAKIQLSGWRRALAAQDIPAVTITQAFLPAVREHLLAAYGWFLLEVSGSEQLTGQPPRGCAGLPDIAAGRAVPGEIREFHQLETQGWLAEIVSDHEVPVRATPMQGNLAVAAPELTGCERAQQWIDNLEALFDRMSNSLDEY
ncbi:MAG: hypothetical protein DRR04_00485 [Gammaproteobacteria bacterium]|nr:MAG: hypothetical protein DRQ97_00960 [Gammaproteobacteria bacterium]RLA62333.1 MAG: hypothetical protein DRR04_00485 [Gammaproteobacteria bacterium]